MVIFFESVSPSLLLKVRGLRSVKTQFSCKSINLWLTSNRLLLYKLAYFAVYVTQSQPGPEVVMFARSYLFQRLQWSSTEAHRELCYLKGRSDDECQNYVRVFGRQGPDRFLVCGTNAYKPLCRQFTIKVSS